MARRRLTKKGHDYSVLEPRQLLATTGLTQFDGDASIDTGLIVNGNFDQNDVAGATSERTDIDDIPGWNQTDGSSDQVSLVGFNDSPRGTGFHLDDQAGVLESLFQDVNTESGQLYTLAFDLLGRPVDDAADVTSNDLRVLWDGVEVGTYRGITDFWQTFTVDVVGSAADLTRLEIQEVDGAGNDGIGAMLDNLRLVPVTTQTIENGSFEDSASGIIGQDDLPGFSVVADEAEQFADIQSGDASEGTQFVNLDRQADSADILFTDVATEAGGIYFLSFDLRSESGVVGEDEELRVRWNNEWVGSFRGDSDWQSYGFTVRADSDSTRLVFREPGDAFTGDGDGPLLDNIRITQVVPSLAVSVNDSSTLEFTENDADLNVGSRIDGVSSTVENALTGFTASLSDDADTTTEFLRAEGPTGTVESVDGVLTVTEDLSSSEILGILQSLSYANTSEDPTAGTRDISIVANASGISSPTARFTVNVTAENDAPVVADIADGGADIGETFARQAIVTDAEGDNITFTISATGSGIDPVDEQPTIDDDGNISWTPSRIGTAVLTVRATDDAGLFSETQFEVSVTTTIDTGTVLVNSGTALPLFNLNEPVDAAIGETLASFQAQTINGEVFNSIEPGVARIYSVLAHWCPFCQQELPEITDWLAENDLGDDVEFVAASVAVDPARDNYPPADWFASEGFDGTIIVDSTQGQLLELLGTQSFPFLVAVNASGEVVDRFSGLSTAADLDAALAAIRAS